jgi:hypothetical protein
MEVESHRDRHTHLVAVTESANRRGCPVGLACERFGAEAAATEVTVDAFYVTVIAPLGNGLSLSIGRFGRPGSAPAGRGPLLEDHERQSADAALAEPLRAGPVEPRELPAGPRAAPPAKYSVT